MKRKFINGAGWGFLDVYSSKCIHVDDIYSEYISLIKIDKVKQKITVDYEQSQSCLLDDGYKCLMFLPDNEKWCVSAKSDYDVAYNTCNKIIKEIIPNKNFLISFFGRYLICLEH